ncbi:hypothetical protein SAMN04487948_11293 [Halogranum amylolyticum]|uniref:Transglutaminase-like superfamily protein n=1 Tax=Halogranum amylolyticum TaxID=660520 RepID=A0A1H8USR1_9EURY|nr:hypothetical protein [Halogranum amylolyticum]SEP06245.1 hypothetical protein SAMN04487948_11293 [Halogranum amylolyticum]
MVDDSSSTSSRRDRTTRRRLLTGLGAAITAGFAGCVGGGETTRSTEQVSGRLSRRYAVDVDGGRAAFQVDIPKSAYAAARDRDRSFARAVDAARDNDALERVGRQIADEYASDADRLLAAQAVVADIEYTTDRATTGQREYIRYPAETIAEDTGDCEDLALVLAGVLSSDALGFRTGFVIPEGHCAVLVDRDDVPESLLVSDPLTVTVGDREYVYLESVEDRSPGSWARDYGERPLLVAYRDRWYPLDAGALVDHSLETVAGGSGSTSQFF